MDLIYTIPGLGTTKDLFKNISVEKHQLKVLEWPVTKTGMTLKEYAAEFISQIDIKQPVNLMGVSFGGMLCCELAEFIKVNKIVIISSCKNSKELPPTLNLLRTLPLQKLFNEKTFRALASKLSWAVGFKREYLPEFLEMMGDMSPDYFKHSIDMIINWQKANNTQSGYHIHGNADKLLPLRYIRNYDVVENGNHAMIVYKANEINVLLNKYFNGL